MKLLVIICSTRPGRVGLPVGQWFVEHAKSHGKFDVDLADLAEIDLPMLDEPNHPRLQQYENEHTKRWSAIVDSADAYVFVTPEYNFGSPPALVNALNYLYNEWSYKAAGFVSYGGVSGGTRSVQMTKMILTTLKVMPIMEAVNIPFVAKSMVDGVFQSEPVNEKAADLMLAELHRWAEALRALRAGGREA